MWIVSWRWNDKPFFYKCSTYLRAMLKYDELREYGLDPSIHRG